MECPPGTLFPRGVFSGQPRRCFPRSHCHINAAVTADQLAICRKERNACRRIRRDSFSRDSRGDAPLRGNGSGQHLYLAGDPLCRELPAVGIHETRCPQL